MIVFTFFYSLLIYFVSLSSGNVYLLILNIDFEFVTFEFYCKDLRTD